MMGSNARVSFFILENLMPFDGDIIVSRNSNWHHSGCSCHPSVIVAPGSGVNNGDGKISSVPQKSMIPCSSPCDTSLDQRTLICIPGAKNIQVRALIQPTLLELSTRQRGISANNHRLSTTTLSADSVFRSHLRSTHPNDGDNRNHPKSLPTRERGLKHSV